MVRTFAKNSARIFGFLSSLPFLFRTPKILPPDFVSHSKWGDYLEKNFNKEGLRVLEIGSRNVTGANFRGQFSKASYTGFDFHPGENVDVVGDAHRLTEYL